MQQPHADQSTDRVIPDPEPRPTEKGQHKPPQGRKDARFWATILVINIAYFLPLLETVRPFRCFSYSRTTQWPEELHLHCTPDDNQ